MATLKDIAGNLNLSVMAVSKALRDAPDIAKNTKELVKKEAQRIGYVPNLMARNLRGGSSGLIGVILPVLNDTYSGSLLSGLELEASARGYQLLVAASQNNGATETACVMRMIERQVEALFVLPLARVQQRSAILDAAASQKTPLIFLHHYPAQARQYPNVAWVAADAQKGAELATAYLMELGHRDILYLSGPPASSFSAEHMTGFHRSLTRGGLNYDDGLVFLAGQDFTGGRQAMARALAEEVVFSAVLCVNDQVAIGACEILKQQGYAIPDDVSVIGFGDGPMAANYAVPLTTIRHPQSDLARAGFNIWMQSRESRQLTGGKLMPVELIERSSCGRKRQ